LIIKVKTLPERDFLRFNFYCASSVVTIEILLKVYPGLVEDSIHRSVFLLSI